MKDTDLLAWIDIETTGLDPLEDQLLEIACIVTTQDLFEISRDSWVIHYNVYNTVLPKPIPQVVIDMHEASGLWDDAAYNSIPQHQWVEEFEAFLQNCLDVNPDYKKFVMAGSGVARFDYTWFQFNFQRILEKFQYYCFDVGILRRALVIAGILDPLENKSLAHRAMIDIEDHLEEWRYYRGILKLTNKEWEAWVPNAWRTDS